MLDAFRVLWAALVGLYDEALVLIRGNLFWLMLAIPLYVATAALLLPIALMGAGSDSGSALAWPFLLPAPLLVMLPSPGSIGLGALAAVIARHDSPPFEECLASVRRYWRRGLLLFAISAVGLAVLAGNLVFYASVAPGVLRFAAIVWLYALLFWLALQTYLVPLLLRVPGASVLDLYRRASLLTLGHPVLSLVLVVMLLVLAVLSLAALPAFVLVMASYAALAQALAFRMLRVRHQDLRESEQEPAP